MPILQILLDNPSHTFSALVVGLLSVCLLFVIKFYVNRRNYPAGPFPLPILGNILMFRGVKKHVHHIFEDIGAKYGGIFTFYMGNEPQVIVTDPHLGLEILKRHQFAGRPSIPLIDIMFEEGSADVIFSDFNKEWEVLRKVIHSAVRKYAAGDRLPVLVAQVVDNLVKKTDTKKPIDMFVFLEKIMYTILAASAFGHQYTSEDEEIRNWIEAIDFRFKNFTPIVLWTYLPFWKYIDRQTNRKLQEITEYQKQFAAKKYHEHEESFESGKIRDFTDALIFAKREAQDEENGSPQVLKYLKPHNIQNAMQDLFLAGVETSRITLLWAFLILASYPEVQSKVREEVLGNIVKKEVPNLTHKNKCHYTTSFVAEVLRWRLLAPTGVPHKTTVDVEIDGHKFKKDTMITVVLTSGLNDKETWGDPEVFRPERFLDGNGQYIPRINALYTPFSAGRRTCPGEKLALADIFFVIARFIQLTEGFEIILPKAVDLGGNINETAAFTPNHYNIALKKIEDDGKNGVCHREKYASASL